MTEFWGWCSRLSFFHSIRLWEVWDWVTAIDFKLTNVFTHFFPFLLTLYFSCLMYFLLSPGEGALCSIPIENILAVERLEEESFKMKNVRTPHSNPHELCRAFNIWAQITPYSYLASFLTSCPIFPPPDVPGYSTRARTLHPGQQLRRGTWLDRHPDQSQPVQPQTLKHLPSFSLPQRPLALLQVLSRHSSWVYSLHWVKISKSVQHQVLIVPFPLSHCPACMCFQ